MATNRRTAIYVIAVTAVLAATCYLSWLSSQPIMFDNPAPWLWIDVQFEEDYLNVTMTNDDNHGYIISEVILSNRQGTILAGELGPKPISSGEQISVCIDFNWTSGHYYEIIVRTTEGKSILDGTYAP